MSEFALLYRSTLKARQAVLDSPERSQHSLVKWRAWFEEMRNNGQLRNPGQPLEGVGKVVGGSKKAITDGPYAETKEVIGGFSLIEARNLDHAAQIASGCPILDIGGSVEVRPVKHIEI